MGTEEEQTEELGLLDVGRLPREQKRAKENEAAAAAERREATSVFFERSWRRHRAETLTEVRGAIDSLGREKPAPAAPASEPLVEGLSPEESRAVTGFLGASPSRANVVQRGERGLLVEVDDRLLSVRGSEVRELSETKELPAEPRPTAVVPDPAPEPEPLPLPAQATTDVAAPGAPEAAPERHAPAPQPSAQPDPAEQSGPTPAASLPPDPAQPAPSPANEEQKGLRAKLPFGRKKDAAATQAAPPAEEKKGGLRAKLPFGKKAQEAPSEPAPAEAPEPAAEKPGRLAGLKGKLPFGRKKE